MSMLNYTEIVENAALCTARPPPSSPPLSYYRDVRNRGTGGQPPPPNFGKNRNTTFSFNPVWHGIGKARKMLKFGATKGQLLLDLMSQAECQNNSIDLNFHLKFFL